MDYYTPEEDEVLRSLVSQGKSIQECADALGKTYGSVASRKNRLKIGKKVFKWDDKNIKTMVDMAQSGYTMKDVAKKIGCSQTTVRKKASAIRIGFLGSNKIGHDKRTYGTAVLSPSEWNADQTEGLFECWASGWTVGDTAEELGMHPKSVENKAISLGIALKGMDNQKGYLSTLRSVME